MTEPTHGIVLGGGWAGMLAAHVLARHVERVTVVERDVLPDGPRHRKGSPQGRHVHVLWSSGARIVDTLLPGMIDQLLDAGARRIGFHQDLVTLTSHGWQHRFPPRQYALMCTRPFLDWKVRDRVLATGRITVRQRSEILDLIGDAKRVTGVRVRDMDTGAGETLEADLVVDSSGRGSRLRHWLSALEVPPLEEDIVDAGIAYATRVYQGPPGAAAGFPAVNVAADHRLREPGRFGVVYPQEDGTWMVTLSCTRGAGLPTHDDEFLPYARTLRHPLVADLIALAKPLTSVAVSRVGANRRLYPERLDIWPEGLLVLGDALAAFNPIYGHGMSSAARAAAALDTELQRSGIAGGTTHRAQQAISATVDDPWVMAASKDVEYVNCRMNTTDPRLTGGAVARQRFSDLIADRSIRSSAVCDVVTDVISLTAPQSELASSRFLSLMQKDRVLPELTEPPLTADELALVDLSPRSTVGAGGS
ncbi:FAD-dependent oxidoreductase [Streptomyces sp. 110]|uniref:FAD-dependent oxidoreductase n=1 Tax=Streptomyces endocoffeicus TaxID=2898945 RepID=A0ABS1PI83_9ACTN|nr:FAD-dependent monooxygenase [Streptomyces endocoffeicus]MBL1111730.1 FAD-dependent oxidoreductase [Streptomyces endocoffeicus]